MLSHDFIYNLLVDVPAGSLVITDRSYNAYLEEKQELVSYNNFYEYTAYNVLRMLGCVGT